MIPLFFTVGAESRRVPCAKLAWLLVLGYFPLHMLDFVLVLLDEGHEALVAGGQRGVIQHQLFKDVLLIRCGCG